MSRVGKAPITIPQGVEVAIKEDVITAKGALGSLSVSLNPLIKVESASGKLTFLANIETAEASAMRGTMRQLVNNMINGVSKGFEKKLTLIGVGYKAAASGNKRTLAVG